VQNNYYTTYSLHMLAIECEIKQAYIHTLTHHFIHARSLSEIGLLGLFGRVI